MQNFNSFPPFDNPPSKLSTRKLAISHGSVVSDSVEMPHTSAKALKYTVELNSGNELIFIQADGSGIVQTYVQIWEYAERILAGLRSLGLQPGNSIIFQLDTSQDFAPALWSCIMGGFIPVPVPIASDYSKTNQALSRLDNIWQQLDNPTILTSSKLASQVHTGLQLYSKKNVKIATIEEIETYSPDTRLHQLQPDELALLLPSSGTTGKPKLIEINSQTFISRFLKNAISQNKDSPGKTFLSWFPLESISGIFTSLPNRFQKNIYLPVELLIRNPLFWLDTLSKHRVTDAQTSNFILANVLDQLRTNTPRDWDFSLVQYIGIGAEPIVAKIARSFLEILGQYNLNPNVLGPAYGMTECAPIAVSREGFSLTTTSDSDRFVEIGGPSRGHSIRIVDQQGCILEEGQIGRIQVQGPSMTSGYYQAPELTRELFTEDGWINTGDLGFLKDGKLTITGREKETIIINAHNYSCQEIELVVEEVEGIEPAYTVACAIRQQDSDTDELAIFFHTLITEDSQLAKQIRGKVTQTLGINPTYIIPLEKEAIPRTATSKIQRLQLKQSLEAGEFDAIIKRFEALIKQESEKIFVSPRTPLEQHIADIWTQLLKLDRVGIHDNFFELGGHSLLAVRLLTQVEKALQTSLPLSAIFQAPTIAELALVLRSEVSLTPWYSLVPIQPQGSRPILFGIHSFYFDDLTRQLGPEQPIYGLRYGMGEPMDRKLSLPPMVELAAHYIEEMRSLQPTGPYFLMGFCAGGIVAYEMAQQLVAQGQQVALLVLFDADIMDEKLRARNRALFKLSPKLLDSEYFPRTADSVELVCKLLVYYTPQPYSSRILLFKAMNNGTGEVPVTHDMRLRKLVGGDLEIVEIPGDHKGILEEPHVRLLAEKLRSCIDRILAD